MHDSVISLQLTQKKVSNLVYLTYLPEVCCFDIIENAALVVVRRGVVGVRDVTDRRPSRNRR